MRYTKSYMQVWALFQWWYGKGWVNEGVLQLNRLAKTADYFSFGTLLRTLFAPFRQIDAGSARGGLPVQLRAWFDRTLSRIVGASARLVLFVVGGLWWLLSAVLSVCWLVLWPLLPLAPLLGVVFVLLRVGAP